MQVAVGSRAAAQGPLALALTVYHRLITRTGFAQALTSTPGGAALERVTPVPVGTGNLSPSLDLTVGTGPPSAAGPSIGLNCAGSGTCPGVYPVSVTLEQTGGTVLGQFNTFLTYEQSASSNPLRFALVVPFAAGVHVLPGSSNAATALAAPSRQAVDNLAGFARTLAARATVPITVLADPHTVQALQVAGSTEAHQALATLSSLSQNPAGTEFPSTPYVPVDLGALAAAGLTGEIVYQMKVGAAALTKAAIHTDPAGTTWVATGGVTGSLATGMSDAGREQGGRSRHGDHHRSGPAGDHHAAVRALVRPRHDGDGRGVRQRPRGPLLRELARPGARCAADAGRPGFHPVRAAGVVTGPRGDGDLPPGVDARPGLRRHAPGRVREQSRRSGGDPRPVLQPGARGWERRSHHPPARRAEPGRTSRPRPPWPSREPANATTPSTAPWSGRRPFSGTSTTCSSLPRVTGWDPRNGRRPSPPTSDRSERSSR